MKSPASVPYIRVDLETAHARLQEMIASGTEMLGETIETMGHMRSAERKYHQWNSTVYHALTKMFNRREISREYAASPMKIGRVLFVDTTLEEIRAKHMRIVREKVEKLQAIKASLDLLGLRSLTKSTILLLHDDDSEASKEILTLLHKNYLQPIILKEYANAGKTIINEIESDPRIQYAIAVLSPQATPQSPAPRMIDQNLILELGIFIGRLGRKRVSAIIEGDPLLPRDFHDFQYLTYSRKGEWIHKLCKELQECGYDVCKR
ncbi:MAG: nucleotide-binding protein [Candidatus Cloacimonetes bacterium]|nr:nucleotide-binding protein [Candidatus Cloacimonadota bacterium]